MAFAFSDQHIDQYHTQGFTLFRQILPPSLLGELRRVATQARGIARQLRGNQTQRLQPVGSYPELDQQPFIDYAELAPLNDAIHRTLSPRHSHGNRQMLGILLEPGDLPWCTQWHRDWRDNVSGLDLALWDAHFGDLDYFNQVNCALYEDGCTWVVPGSHLRRDLPGEAARFPERPIAGPDLEGRSYEERERLCLDYCRSMPGAVRLHLEAGDFCLYRNSLWHLGNYLPYQQRATLHDAVDTPEFLAWRSAALANAQQRRDAGHGMDNPNKAR